MYKDDNHLVRGQDYEVGGQKSGIRTKLFPFRGQLRYREGEQFLNLAFYVISFEYMA